MATTSFLGPGVDPRQVIAALTGAGFHLRGPRPVRRSLLDTFDGRLHAGGLRLELVSAAGTELVLRGGGPAPAQAPVEVVPRLAGDLPAGPLRERLAPLLGVRALGPVLTMDARQVAAVRRDDTGKSVVTVRVYTDVTSGSAGLPLVVEVSPFVGFEAAGDRAVQLMASLGMSIHQGDAIDVLAERSGVDLRGFSGSPTVTLDPSEPAGAGFGKVLVNLADTIDANWQGTVEDIDPEFLHDLRVAVRRTRSVLTHAKGVLPGDGRSHFRAEFGWLGTVTTPLRDLDVYLIEWPGYVAPLGTAADDLAPVLGQITRRRVAAQAALADTLRSGRYRAVMTGWRAWIGGETVAAGSAGKSDRPVGAVVAARLADAQGRLLNRGRAIDAGSPAEALHELRKDAKKLRYLLECFGGVLPAGPRKAFVSRLKALQDNLGEHQDTEVHTAQLRVLSEELHGAPGVTAATLLAMGRLTEAFDQRRKQARAVFAGRFAAYDTAQTERALSGLLAAAVKR